MAYEWALNKLREIIFAKYLDSNPYRGYSQWTKLYILFNLRQGDREDFKFLSFRHGSLVVHELLEQQVYEFIIQGHYYDSKLLSVYDPNKSEQPLTLPVSLLMPSQAPKTYESPLIENPYFFLSTNKRLMLIDSSSLLELDHSSDKSESLKVIYQTPFKPIISHKRNRQPIQIQRKNSLEFIDFFIENQDQNKIALFKIKFKDIYKPISNTNNR